MTDDQNTATPPPDNIEDLRAMLEDAREKASEATATMDYVCDGLFRLECQKHRMTDTFEEYATRPGGNQIVLWVCFIVALLAVAGIGSALVH